MCVCVCTWAGYRLSRETCPSFEVMVRNFRLVLFARRSDRPSSVPWRARWIWPLPPTLLNVSKWSRDTVNRSGHREPTRRVSVSTTFGLEITRSRSSSSRADAIALLITIRPCVCVLLQMTGPQKKKKHHVGDTFYKRKYKTKHRARDIDEVQYYGVYTPRPIIVVLGRSNHRPVSSDVSSVYPWSVE